MLNSDGYSKYKPKAKCNILFKTPVVTHPQEPSYKINNSKNCFFNFYVEQRSFIKINFESRWEKSVYKLTQDAQNNNKEKWKSSTKQNGETIKDHNLSQKYFNLICSLEITRDFTAIIRAYAAQQGAFITWKQKVPQQGLKKKKALSIN